MLFTCTYCLHVHIVCMYVHIVCMYILFTCYIVYMLFTCTYCYMLYSCSDAVELWDIEGKFQIKVASATNLNVSKDTSVSI